MHVWAYSNFKLASSTKMNFIYCILKRALLYVHYLFFYMHLMFYFISICLFIISTIYNFFISLIYYIYHVSHSRCLLNVWMSRYHFSFRKCWISSFRIISCSTTISFTSSYISNEHRYNVWIARKRINKK